MTTLVQSAFVSLMLWDLLRDAVSTEVNNAIVIVLCVCAWGRVVWGYFSLRTE